MKRATVRATGSYLLSQSPLPYLFNPRHPHVLALSQSDAYSTMALAMISTPLPFFGTISYVQHLDNALYQIALTSHCYPFIVLFSSNCPSMPAVQFNSMY